MATIDSSLEPFSLSCRNCGYSWEETYEVRHSSDLFESERTQYFSHGLPVDSPWTGARCPRCTGLRVSVMPSHG